MTQRKGNFLEADELLAVIEAAAGIDEPVSPDDGGARRAGAADARRRPALEGDRGGARRRARARRSGLPAAAGTRGTPSARRAILATLGCAGLRNSEVCALNLGDLDFAHGVIHVRDAKTEAGVRQVNMTPWLRDELLAYRATPPDARARRARVPHATGARRDKDNMNRE